MPFLVIRFSDSNSHSSCRILSHMSTFWGWTELLIYFLTICFTSISYYIKWRNSTSRHVYEAVMNGCRNLTCVCQCKHHVSALSDLSSGQHYIVERHGRIHPVRVGRYLPGHHQPLQQKGWMNGWTPNWSFLTVILCINGQLAIKQDKKLKLAEHSWDTKLKELFNGWMFHNCFCEGCPPTEGLFRWDKNIPHYSEPFLSAHIFLKQKCGELEGGASL